jgi:ABC-type transport system involved in multi-copper enzyme maturation permease subunit
MRARLVKEIRQLAPWPAAGILLLFAVPPFLGTERLIVEFYLVYLVLAVFAPAARLFGAEFDHGTLERLLSQPISRRRIWREKLCALAVVLALAFFALQLARRLFLGSGPSAFDLVVCLAAFSGGPLVSLYLRESFLALWGSMSLPAVPIWGWLYLIYLSRGDFHVGFFWVHVPPMILYVAIAYVVGRRRFLTLELDQVPTRRLGVSGWLRVQSPSTFGPTARLLLKEIQIQGANLLVLPAFLVVWGVAYGLALAEPPGPGQQGEWLSIVGAFPPMRAGLVIFLFPLLVGATAVAAERQMGLAGWHSSLPVSRARQWWVKVLVVMSLAVAGGGALGGYLDRLLFTLLEARGVASTPLPATVIWLSIFSAAAGMYASSRAREPFRALMGGVALFLLPLVPATSPAALQIRGAGLRSFFFPELPEAGLYLGITLPTLALLAFAFQNFRPEPWLWETSGGRALQWVVLGGLLLATGFWY